MPRPAISTWVKNVHNLRIAPWTSGVRFSPILNNSLHITPQHSHNSLFIRPIIPAFYPLLSTSFLTHFNLLYDRLYTQSTAPTIKKKKENIRKEQHNGA